MRILKEVFVSLGAALATTAGLFTLQIWYSSYLDVAIVHGDLSAARMDAQLAALRAEEQAKLTTGRMPIDKAMEALAQRGRNASPELAAKPSNDLSAMSGWVHKPGFKPYVPRQPGGAPAVQAAPPPGGAAAAPNGAPPGGVPSAGGTR